ncbi:phosphoglycerate kinase [Chloroflexota bacterium]
MEKMTVRNIEVGGKRALVRVDFNVPLDEKTGTITDDTRIRAALPTIEYLIERGAKVILCSHLGRPKGKTVDKLRLAPVGERLAQILGKPVTVAKDSIGAEVEKTVEELKNGDVLLLENIRFHPEEEENDAAFAKALARLADIYVNDAFGTAHRAHASTAGIADYLPAVSGMLLEKELNNLGSILTSPAHPFATLLGGAKVSDKIGMIENIMDKVDSILIGGGMAATFLKAKSYEVGQSLVEDDRLSLTTKLMEDMERRGVHCLLPVDMVVADRPDAEANVQIVSVENIPSNLRIADIGPQTVKLFSQELRGCKTVFWNGPMGIYEIPKFAEGTKAMAGVLADLGATTVIGGGSTAEAVTEMGLADKMTFISTGGGASLEFLSGQTLPGVEVLLNKEAQLA